MSNAWANIFVAFIMVMLLFIYPLFDCYLRQDDIAYSFALQTVTTFVDSVRDKGYVTPQMYNDFYRQLAMIDNIYNIELEHLRKNYDPIYEDVADQGTFQDDFVVNYNEFYTGDILAKLFPHNHEPIDSQNRRYKMEVGDFFYVKVTRINETPSFLISSWLGMGYHPNIIIP